MYYICNDKFDFHALIQHTDNIDIRPCHAINYKVVLEKLQAVSNSNMFYADADFWIFWDFINGLPE